MNSKFVVQGLGLALALSFMLGEVNAQSGRNPWRPADGLQAGTGPGLIGQPWAKMPGGRAMGSPGGVHIDSDGEHVWAIIRCGDDGTPRGSQTYCDQSDLDPILRFDPDGNVVTEFGSRMFAWPHGLHVDGDRQHLGHRSGKRRISFRAAIRSPGIQVLAVGRSPHDAGRGRRVGRRAVPFHQPQRYRDRAERRHLRC